ncbi:MAG TPA: hypothetical protein VNI52_05535 [Sphingobacteriaceae bacterium]|nr:hypothetical protein [Sphingobacteriaceae bacterium]
MHTNQYQVKSPVLFLVFNRPDMTERVFEKIREAKPSRLYIAADGPRQTRIGEFELCEKVRSVITKIDWLCEVHTLFRSENLGCKYAVSSSISWFFEHEDEGIILEDDCLPANDFFRFCDEMLSLYKDDDRIRHITGCNLQFGKRWGTDTYYFSNNVHVWGWATWKRVWEGYDVEMQKYGEDEVEEQLSKIFSEELFVESWIGIFKQLKTGKIDTWDYQLGLINFFNNGLCIIPNYNLVSNMGFGSDSTHTFDANDANADIPLEVLPYNITHPKYFVPQRKADLFTLYRDFNIERRRAKARKKKFKRWLGLT